MRIALAEAARGLGKTSPNPAVGAALVVGHKVVATGFHKEAGAAHAEIKCLRNLRSAVPAKATLYVTLEPCSTEGRTGACTRQIIAAGVRRVVIGATDPNPRHSGRGIEILRKAGVEVRTGILADECNALNEPFNKWIRTRMPFVVAKCGMSLDGGLTRRANENRWLTSSAARRHAQHLRATVDAIIVGAETIRADNPHLTVRGIRGAKQPLRVVLSRSGRLPPSARIFTDKHAAQTRVFRGKSLRTVLRELGRQEITSVLIEGGGDILGQAFDARVIDKVQIYVAPLLTGGAAPAFGARGVSVPAEGARLERVTYERIGQDLCITGYPMYAGTPT